MKGASVRPAPGPLQGVRVLELASVVLAPWACQILGDLGADVIKIEPPGGDSNRQVGPGHEQGLGALFLTCNRNKRSLVLDLKKPAGRQVLGRLLVGADVLVHNLRPPAARRLGLDWEALQARHPLLVLCGTYGFGADGPYAERAAYDDSIQAAAGLAELQRALGGAPAFVPTIVADKVTALTVVYAVLAALFARQHSGRGQQVEVPMFESLVAFLAAEHLYGQAFDPPRGRAGYARVLSPQRRPFATRDGYLAVLPYLDRHWRAFCELSGRDDLRDDPRFATLADRVRHVDEVYAAVGEALARGTSAEWLHRLERAGVPVTPVRSLDELVTDPHLEAVGFWQPLEHPLLGRLRAAGAPTRFSATPASVRRAPPELGQHSLEVLREAGLTPQEIAALLAQGVTRDGSAPEPE